MRYCENCGKELDGGKFCSYCGAPIDSAEMKAEEKPSIKIKTKKPEAKKTSGSTEEKVSPSGEIILGNDGKLRWSYELNMLRNPSILMVLFKIFAGVLLGLYLFLLLLEVVDGGFRRGGLDSWIDFTKYYLLFAVGFFALILLGYLLYAAMMGGTYSVLFVMDEKGVDHIVAPKKMKKAQVMAEILMLSGMAEGKVGRVGQGLLISSKNSSSSHFEYVKSVYCYPRIQLIKVNELFSKNQVYCKAEDFEFVKNYIISRCVNAKKIRG